MNSPHRIAHTTPPQWPPIKPGQLAATIRTDLPDGCRIALLGLPDDTGVKLNGGRPGAAQGPGAFRAALASYGTPWDARHARPLPMVFDAGDVEPATGDDESALLELHARVEIAVRQSHELGLVPICIGGGHDLSLPSITALSKLVGTAIGGINFDAHLDVRERVGSGMAFRRLIDGGHLNPRRFAEVGLGRFVHDEADVNWLSNQGATLMFADSLIGDSLPSHRLLESACQGSAGFVSIDLDGIDASAAPGVSAPNPCGLGVHHAAALAEAAGAEPAVRHFDLMELSPPHDHEGRTARVAALLFLSFLAGFGGRT
jgi:formimidoylglutamase